jgi:hypothetical protein
MLGHNPEAFAVDPHHGSIEVLLEGHDDVPATPTASTMPCCPSVCLFWHDVPSTACGPLLFLTDVPGGVGKVDRLFDPSIDGTVCP